MYLTTVTFIFQRNKGDEWLWTVCYTPAFYGRLAELTLEHISQRLVAIHIPYSTTLQNGKKEYIC